LGASQAPPVTRDARRQGHTGPPRRAQADARALTAAAHRAPGNTGRSKPDQPIRTAAASRTRARSVAVARKRRHHSRTVVSGRPRVAAIRRTPTPVTASSSACPMTSVVSHRYGVTNQGSRAAVAPQRRQRTLGTKMRWSSLSRRWRRYPDQGPVGPPQRGQAGRGGDTSRPRAAYVLTSSLQGHTITNGGPCLHHDPPRANIPRGVTWLRRSDHRAARRPLSTSPFSVAITSGSMPIQGCRQHPWRSAIRARAAPDAGPNTPRTSYRPARPRGRAPGSLIRGEGGALLRQGRDLPRPVGESQRHDRSAGRSSPTR